MQEKISGNGKRIERKSLNGARFGFRVTEYQDKRQKEKLSIVKLVKICFFKNKMSSFKENIIYKFFSKHSMKMILVPFPHVENQTYNAINQ